VYCISGLVIRRLKHNLSLSSLNEITNTITTLEFGHSNPNPASIGEIENDKIFLVQFMLPLAGVVIKTKLPKLTALAEIAKTAAKGKAFAFYTPKARAWSSMNY
jgi:hypothetical protein